MSRSEGPQIGTVKTADFEMDYLTFGHGSRILVILPGISVQSVLGTPHAIVRAYRLLADDFTIYLFDRRKDMPQDYSISSMASDTAAAMQEIGIGSASIFGVSQGGMIAMQIAADHPELVTKLVLGSTSAYVGEEQCTIIDGWIAPAKEGDAAALYLAFCRAIYPEKIFEGYRRILAEASAAVTAEDLERFIIACRAAKSFDIRSRLSAIACPVLVTGDTDDRIFGAEEAHAIIDGLSPLAESSLYISEGYGHAAYDTAPDYKERMLGFLLR